jgi:hypothetical protein
MTARLLRRLSLWLLVPVLGTAGTLVVATPSQAATTCTADYLVVSTWNATPTTPAGWQGQFTVTNTSATTTTTWRTGFHFVNGAYITEYWNANAVSIFLKRYYRNAVFNGTLAPGQSTTWGFIARSSPLLPDAHNALDVTCVAA